MLTLILPQVLDIVSIHSNLKLECVKFREGKIQKKELVQNTHEMKEKLSSKTKELVATLKILCKRNESLFRDCHVLSNKMKSQANRICNSLNQPINFNEAWEGINELESNITILDSILCSHFDELASKSEMENIESDCLKKFFHSVKEHPIPVFETEINEYNDVVDNLTVEYPDSSDGRLSENRKILEFPGVSNFLESLVEAEKRKYLLRLIKKYDSSDPSAIYPFSNEIVSLLPCVETLELGFSSEEELKHSFVRFFRDGNWLEAYTYFMLNRAGCSTRLLNVNLRYEGIVLEADVLALFRNRFFIFEAKDRSGSSGFSESDLTDIKSKIENVGKMKAVSIVFIINAEDEQHDSIKKQIEEIASEKGVPVNTIFLLNRGIDTLASKIRMVLR